MYLDNMNNEVKHEMTEKLQKHEEPKQMEWRNWSKINEIIEMIIKEITKMEHVWKTCLENDKNPWNDLKQITERKHMDWLKWS